MSWNKGWDCVLRIGDFWGDKLLSFEQLRDELIARLEIVRPQFNSDRLDEIIHDFSITENDVQFDKILEELFDWADMNKRLFIDFYSVPEQSENNSLFSAEL